MSYFHRRYRARFVLPPVLALFVSFTHLSVGAPDRPDKEPALKEMKSKNVHAFHGDRLLVKPKKGISKDKVRSLHGQLGATTRRTFTAVGGLQVVDLPAGMTVEEAKKHYEASGLVEYAEPDYIVQMDTHAPPNDPKYADGTLWGLNNLGQNGGTTDADIDAPEAWDTLLSAPNVVVAVIDTGVRYTHEDLTANIWTNLGETPGNGMDDDQNGYVDDIHGWNAITGAGDPMDDNGHGTHVAGTIGGVGNNGIGVLGVAWQVQIMACKFLNASGSGSTSDAIECIDYARRNGANVMNNSWGGGGFSQALFDAITAARSNGVIFVASAGNNAVNTDLTPQYPAGYDVDNVVAVAATDRNDQLASFSNFGRDSVELGAPGVSIYSTYGSSNTAYNTLNGTSMSAPHVSGVMALTIAQFPGMTYSEIIRRVVAAADPISSLALKTMSGARLNLHKALTQDPIAYFSATPLRGPVPLSVSFADGSVGTITTRTWDFGDGSPSSSELAPNNTYSNAGSYNATLTVSGPINTSSRTRVITAYVPIFYEISSTNFSWIDPGSMTDLVLPDDGVSAGQELPFAFEFYGQAYSTVYVGANGLLGFGLGGMSKYLNGDLPDMNVPNAVICPFWDDLNPGVAGSIHIGTVGTAPDQICVVSWVGVPHYSGGAAPTHFYTFQALLYEGSNEIVFQYLEVQPGGTVDRGVSATVGIENDSGEMAAKYSWNGSALVGNNQAIRFSSQESDPNPNPNPEPGILSVSPSTGFNSAGEWPGPYSPPSKSYWLSNTGSNSITWMASKLQNFVSLSATGGVLWPGTSNFVTVAINANGLSVGTYADTVTFTNISSGAGSTTRGVTLTITQPPVINISPWSRDFGSVTVGSSAERTFTVLNFGGGTLTGTASVSAAYSVVSGSNYSLAALASTNVTVRFSPTAAGAFPTNVTFTGGGNATAPVTGTGVVATAIISVTPSSRDYGAVAVGSSSNRTFTVSNIGSGTLTGTASVPPPYYSVVSGASYSLAAGATSTVTVAFSPTAAGGFPQTVTFTGGSNATRSVTGTGVVSLALISVTPALRDYGDVTVGNYLNQTFTVKNIGVGTLTGTATVAEPYSVVSGPSYNLAAGASSSVKVRFRPTEGGTFTQTVTFTGGGNATNTVTGTGVVLPAAPSNLQGTVNGSNVTISWTDNSSDETGFKIERRDKAQSGGSWRGWSQVATVGAGVTTWTDTGLQRGWHNHRVRAYRGTVNSEYSNTAQTRTY